MRAGVLLQDLNEADLGIRILGVSTIAFGIACFLQGDFTIYWQPVPDDFPLRQPLAYASAALLVLSGAGLFHSRTMRTASLIQIGLFIAYAISWLSRLSVPPAFLLGISEQLAIAVGAATIWAQLSPEMANRIGFRPTFVRVAYGCFSIVFGLAHIIGVAPTAAMVPDWIMGSGEFWALFTGACHIAVGLALIANILAILATRLAGLMYFGFAAIVWTPGAITHPDQWLRWAGDAITLTLMGAVWLVGDHLWRAGERPAHRAAVLPVV